MYHPWQYILINLSLINGVHFDKMKNSINPWSHLWCKNCKYLHCLKEIFANVVVAFFGVTSVQEQMMSLWQIRSRSLTSEHLCWVMGLKRARRSAIEYTTKQMRPISASDSFRIGCYHLKYECFFRSGLDTYV